MTTAQTSEKRTAHTKAISEKVVGALPVPDAGNKVYFFSGTSLQGKKAPAGFGVRVTSAGTRTFVWFHRVDGKKHLETIGTWRGSPGGGDLAVLDAIINCAARAGAVATGVQKDKRGKIVKDEQGKPVAVDARPARTRRLEDGDKTAGLKIGGAWRNGENKKEQPEPGLLDIFIKRHAREIIERNGKKETKLRSADQIEATFERLVYPDIGEMSIYDVRRSHIVSMLDDIEDESGPVMADRTLAYVRSAFNWYAAKRGDDEFSSPIAKGMSRTNGKQRSRKRVLADDELRDLWTALDTIDDPACYPFYVKTLLLTATRRTESARMSSTELDGDVWTIPADRYKTKLDHVIPLSATARELIRDAPAPKVSKNARFIFSTTEGEVPFSGYSKAKAELDKAIADIRKKAEREPMANWTLHDLRRTARSLMSRAKVPTDHAERALGHVIGGVRETYDRWSYADEKRAAFEALAAIVSNILNPELNVVPLRKA